MRHVRLLAALAASAGCLAGCAADPVNGLATQPDAGVVVTIQNYAYSPLDFTVDAGTVIAVHNLDAHTHTLTSEAQDKAYEPGAVDGIAFDTGGVDANRWGVVQIPANAPSGTTLPYYCFTHGAGMATPDGHITIR